MFLALAAAVQAAAMPMPATPMVGRFRCGIEDATLTVRRAKAYLTVGRAQYALTQVRAASGARYRERGVEFWTKGDTATLTVGKRMPVSCLARNADDQKPYRARGQEPGWLLDLDLDTAARTATFTHDYGKAKAVEPLRAFAVVDGARRWASVSGRLTVTARPGGCSDSMSGETYPDTVTVAYRGKTYQGCGGPMATTAAPGFPGGEWVVEDIAGGGVIDNSRATIEVRDGRIAGRGSCNRYTGSVTVTGDKLKVGPLASTRMACAPALMTQEQTLLKLLESATGYAVRADGALVVTGADGRTIVARKA